jgi:hypothetical protein
MSRFPNDREFSRSPAHVHGVVTFDGHAPLEGRTRDVSLGGFYLYTFEAPPLGTTCRVSLTLEGSDLPPLTLRGTVVRKDIGGLAVRFDEIDADSLEPLRNLVLYNAADPEVASREMREHVGLRRP